MTTVQNTAHQVDNLTGYVKPRSTEKPNYKDRLLRIVYPIMNEIRFSKMNQIKLAFSQPIDPIMAYATSSSISVCPLFVIDLSDIPSELRPVDWKDPRLCDLNYLQKLSDWIAEECNIPKQKVSFIEAAAAKTIIKLKQDPEGHKALRAGMAHELGHVALGHSSTNRKSIREREREADLYAAIHLQDGLEGIKIGFKAWQKSLRAVRASSKFNWKERLLMRLLITPQGNLIPLYFTHGFFETRIHQAEQFLKSWNSRR